MFLHYLVCSVWRTVFPTSALFTPLFSQVRQMLRPKVFQLSRILRFVLVSLPSLFVPPSIRVGILPDGRNLDREEVFLRPPKFIRLINCAKLFTPIILMLWPRRPRSFRVASTVNNILSPSLSRVIFFLTVSLICISGRRLEDFERVERGVHEPPALRLPPPSPLILEPLCHQCHRFSLILLPFVRRSWRRYEHWPDHILRELGSRGRVLYCRPSLFLHRLFLLLLHPSQRESVVDPAVDVVDAFVAREGNCIPRRINLIRKLTVTSHGQRGRRQARCCQGVVHAADTGFGNDTLKLSYLAKSNSKGLLTTVGRQCRHRCRLERAGENTIHLFMLRRSILMQI